MTACKVSDDSIYYNNTDIYKYLDYGFEEFWLLVSLVKNLVIVPLDTEEIKFIPYLQYDDLLDKKNAVYSPALLLDDVVKLLNEKYMNSYNFLPKYFGIIQDNIPLFEDDDVYILYMYLFFDKALPPEFTLKYPKIAYYPKDKIMDDLEKIKKWLGGADGRD